MRARLGRWRGGRRRLQLAGAGERSRRGARHRRRGHGSLSAVYHIELRQSFHNLCHFNLDDGALGAIVKAWTTDPWVEIEGRKWNPQQAKLRIIEGPELPLAPADDGPWLARCRTSGHRRLRARARGGHRGGARRQQGAGERGAAQAIAQQAVPDAALEADSLGLELLVPARRRPRAAVLRVAAGGQTLPRAHSQAKRSCWPSARLSPCSKTRLIVLLAPLADGDGGPGGPGSDGDAVCRAGAPGVLNAHESWARPDHSTAVRMRRA